jgi:cbb3-type cytochrome oxidase subunit 3
MVGLGVALVVLIIVIICVVRYCRKKSEKGRMGHVFYKKHKDDGKKKKTDVMNFKFSMSEEETLKLKQDAEKSDSKTAE